MNITLTHPFKDKIPDVDEFFKAANGVGIINTINAFCGRANDLSIKYATTHDPNVFKGDSLELFVEFLIKAGSADNRIGIYDYRPVDSEEDVGVDGVGTGENSCPATVQVKFRRGDYVLRANEDCLSNFIASSWYDYAVRMEDTKNMLIVTTGMKVDERTVEKMLKNSVRVLNREALREMLDNRPEWWMWFYESVKASRIQKQTLPTPPTLREHQLEAVEAAMVLLNLNSQH